MAACGEAGIGRKKELFTRQSGIPYKVNKSNLGRKEKMVQFSLYKQRL
jgi:hypothetical protein